YFYNNVFYENDPGATTFFKFYLDTVYLLNNIFQESDSCEQMFSLSSGIVVYCDSSNLFSVDPGFVNAAAGDYHAAYCSPMIDGGTMQGGIPGDLDLDGNPRLVNLPDIGAYESTQYSPEVEVEDVSCYGNEDGSIVVSPSLFGPPPYVYAWSTGDTTMSLENLGPGTYALTITDANGCTQYASTEIEEPLPVTGFYTAQPASGPDVADGAVWQDSISGGYPPYSYFWNTGENSASLQGLLPGHYELTIVDEQGCWQFLEFEVGFLTGTEEAEAGAAVFWLYPNPSSGKLFVAWEKTWAADSELRFVLYDLQGRKLLEKKSLGANPLLLDLSHLPKGDYVCVLQADGKTSGRSILTLF
ncbi:MAG TPA: T9SS type A sorting domain-containing protein, partial [Phaeodactylibacter sp.]|nr:T9SS type A sorting domain-containing protein [Phaeodactylibacter sp.]